MSRIVFSIILVFAFSSVVNAQKEKGTLKGIVSYFINDTLNQPDIGAEVIIYIPDIKDDVTTMYNYILAYQEWKMLLVLKRKNAQKDVIESLDRLNAYPEDKFVALKKKVRGIITDLKTRKGTVITKTDNTGNYTTKLAPEEYNIVFLSNHSEGDIRLTHITIKAKEIKTENELFK